MILLSSSHGRVVAAVAAATIRGQTNGAWGQSDFYFTHDVFNVLYLFLMYFELVCTDSNASNNLETKPMFLIPLT